jgi:Periplasmic copper-binding protein (NosD)
MRNGSGLLAPAFGILVAAAAALALSPGHALADHVGCGDVITTDTTLDSDLVGCEIGIIVGADGITLDLGGQTISAGVGLRPRSIELTDRRGVTIRNGTISGFGRGISLVNPHSNTIGDVAANPEVLEVVGNIYGIALLHSSRNTIANTVVPDSEIHGITITDRAATGCSRIRWFESRKSSSANSMWMPSKPE